jgi:hypothetical protein
MEGAPVVTIRPGLLPPSTRPFTVTEESPEVVVIAAAALPDWTSAPAATTTFVPDVVTESPSPSVPVQLVVPFATVGSGAHWADAGEAEAAAIAAMLPPSAHDKRRDRALRTIIICYPRMPTLPADFAVIKPAGDHRAGIGATCDRARDRAGDAPVARHRALDG